MVFEFRFPPFALVYRIYSTLSLLLLWLPFWLVKYSVPSWRPRQAWSIRRCLIFRIKKFYVDHAWRTSFNPLRADDLGFFNFRSRQDVGLVWIDASPELICGEIKEAAEFNQVVPEARPGYWYGERGPDGEVGQSAMPNEKVIYHIHGAPFVFLQ